MFTHKRVQQFLGDVYKCVIDMITLSCMVRDRVVLRVSWPSESVALSGDPDFASVELSYCICRQ